jgi:hypothetical protein
LFRLFLLIPCWESQRLIPKRSADPRKISNIEQQSGLKTLDLKRPNREESDAGISWGEHPGDLRQPNFNYSRDRTPNGFPEDHFCDSRHTSH